ncbi:hypothetical protein JT358_06310 [Micrococcales bacterium 31B]|nr:hypothetical protein [Micrococcales bacterium 31B]
MSIFEQIFNPNAARAREFLETEKQLPAPTPTPGKGPLDLDGGGVVKIGDTGDITHESQAPATTAGKTTITIRSAKPAPQRPAES